MLIYKSKFSSKKNEYIVMKKKINKRKRSVRLNDKMDRREWVQEWDVE